MKDLFNNSAFESRAQNGLKYFLYDTSETLTSQPDPESILKPGIFDQMAKGRIPDLMDVCLKMTIFFNHKQAPYSAMQLIPVMQNVPAIGSEQARRFINNRETRHVLMSDDRFELVLIHWRPGKASDIHGHPGGGCLFKLLHGKLEELRYAPEPSGRLLSTTSLRSGHMAYIDDQMAYHQVGNPYGTSAISLHLYLK
jgi:hypothetical protein